MILQGREFHFIGNLRPERTADGSVATHRPQARYAGATISPLHRYGDGEFCSFRLPSAPNSPGVYLMCLDEEIKYVGEAESLNKRMYAYGHISPKNCFVGGRQTNCRINKLVLHVTSTGKDVEVWFHSCDDYKQLEAALIAALRPPWNR